METSEKDNSKDPRNGHGAGAMTLGQRVDRVNEGARDAWSQTRDAFTDIKEAIDLDGRVKRNPYGTIAAAAGIGYVLGGGIFSPLTAWAVRIGLRIGVRLAVLPIVKDQISELAESLTAGGESGAATSGAKNRKSSSNKGT
jgi:hypothetical protein